MKPEELLLKERLEKLKKIINFGINPYPSAFDKKNEIKDIVSEFSKLKKEEKSRKNVKTAGRIMSLREMGKASFFDMQDEKSKIQCFIREDESKKIYLLPLWAFLLTMR